MRDQGWLPGGGKRPWALTLWPGVREGARGYKLRYFCKPSPPHSTSPAIHIIRTYVYTSYYLGLATTRHTNPVSLHAGRQSSRNQYQPLAAQLYSIPATPWHNLIVFCFFNSFSFVQIAVIKYSIVKNWNVIFGCRVNIPITSLYWINDVDIQESMYSITNYKVALWVEVHLSTLMLSCLKFKNSLN